MATYLRAIYRAAFLSAGFSATIGLVLVGFIRSRRGMDDMGYAIVLGPFLAQAYRFALLFTLVGGGAGLWLSAVLEESPERTRVENVSAAALLLEAIVIARIARPRGRRRR